MRVLILGGTGFIGPHIVRRLTAYGHQATIFRRGSGLADSADGVLIIVGDRNRLEASTKEFGDLRPDGVVDAIAYTEEQAKSLLRAFPGIAKRMRNAFSLRSEPFANETSLPFCCRQKFESLK
jgi:uncharacterized protein YbjT (DUF2867 family)